ncbi:MAG TPA: DNA/RNA non-specific endonuclease, partial [Candidatus Phascolarctobacterium stercoravium]|nr:DNA/RNA non-specific endonuclease [Candidatus Phascolarctobacterium stercoravium]
MRKIFAVICSLMLAVSLVLSGCGQKGSNAAAPAGSSVNAANATGIASVPAYSGKPFIAINGNKPNFNEADLTEKSFEKYSPLDSLKRCGTAFANVSKETMPKEKRGSIGQVKPSGWQTAKYDFVDGKYLYNRCHLIGYQLTAENAN